MQDSFANPHFAHTWKAIEWMHARAVLHDLNGLMLAMATLTGFLCPAGSRHGRSHAAAETLVIHCWVALAVVRLRGAIAAARASGKLVAWALRVLRLLPATVIAHLREPDAELAVPAAGGKTGRILDFRAA